MRVDINDFDFDNSSSAINDFLGRARSLHTDIMRCASDSERHVNENARKIQSKISSWTDKLNRLRKMRKECEEAYEREKRRCQDHLDRAQSIRDVMYKEDISDVKFKNYSFEVEFEEREADAARERANKQVERAHEIDEDIKVATAYLNELSIINGVNDTARRNLDNAVNYLEIAMNVADIQSQRCFKAISAMESHINRFNAFNYGNSHQYGAYSKVSVPEFIAPQKLRYATAPKVARGQTAAPKISIPAKMRLFSNDEPIVEIIGPYTDKAELGTDLTTLRKLYPNKCSVCIKKPITTETPCFANIKEMAEFVNLFGFSGRMTAMGTRYTDGEGRIYFNS